MSILDMAMAGGFIVLIVLIVVRLKNR